MVTDSFEKFHPLVNFTFFALVLGFSMTLTHPLAQAISLVCAFGYACLCSGKKAVSFTLKLCLPMLALATVLNPAFNHEGVTVLFYLRDGNALTLESVLYGFSAGCMICEVLLWFLSFNRVVGSDKFIYLFGRIIPSLSLVLSMTLRFVPRFKAQMQVVTDAQKSIGRDASRGSIFKRTKTAVTILSVMITWSLENAIETADSMKSRGYGLPGRTTYSNYRFTRRDRAAMLWLGFCAVFLICGSFASAFSFRFFPSIKSGGVGAMTLAFYLAFALMCTTPIIINVKEDRRWKALNLKM